MNVERILRALQPFLESAGIRYAVIGGFGLHAYGLARATFDVDFVVEATAQRRLVEHLESLGWETLSVTSGYSNHLHGDSALGRLDFVYVRGETADAIFAGCRSMPIVGGVEAPVPRPEHLAAMKAQAIKNDPGRTFQEMADVQFLTRCGASSSAGASGSATVSSSDRSDGSFAADFDLERDLPTTPEDVAIQRRLRRRQRLSPEEFAAFLESLGPRPYEELRARRGPRGEPFTLYD